MSVSCMLGMATCLTFASVSISSEDAIAISEECF